MLKVRAAVSQDAEIDRCQAHMASVNLLLTGTPHGYKFDHTLGGLL